MILRVLPCVLCDVVICVSFVYGFDTSSMCVISRCVPCCSVMLVVVLARCGVLLMYTMVSDVVCCSCCRCCVCKFVYGRYLI